MNTKFTEPELATRMSLIKPSASMAAKQKVDLLRQQGKSIIDFTIGEPDFDTPEHIKQAGIKAIVEGKTKYTSSRGIKALIEAIQYKYQRDNGLTILPEQIIVGSGAKQLIFNALMATLNEGDEVIIPTPYWVSYPEMVILNGGKPVILNTTEENGFKLTAELLEKSITAKTKWLLLNSPNNPSGAIYTKKELEDILDVLAKYPYVRLMVDEIYEHFSFNQEYVSPLSIRPSMNRQILLINGVSKSYAMTGWRVGYAIGDARLISAMSTLISQMTSCVSEFSQYAAAAALTESQECIKKFKSAFLLRRDTLCNLLNSIKGMKCERPDGSFYAFPNIKGFIGKKTPEGKLILSDIDFVNYLIDFAQIAVLDGSAYGVPGHIRISFATELEKIEIACSNIKKACDSLI